MKRIALLVGVLFIGFTCELFDRHPAWAFSLYPENHLMPRLTNEFVSSTPWYKTIDCGWGGHVKLRGSTSWVDGDSLYQPVGTGRYYDGNAEGRFKTNLFFGKWGYFEAHYEVVFSGGDTRRKSKSLAHSYPTLFGSDFPLVRTVEDNRRLMDLTKIIDDDAIIIFYGDIDF